MGYKQKECPACGVKHNKRGQFCSRSCGNKKPHTEETRQLLSQKQTQWLTSGDEKAEVAVHNFVSKGSHKPSEPPPVPSRLPLDNNQFVADGDLWTNCE